MVKLERTKNASRNIFFGVILKIYQILVPFLMRTAMIYLIGVQYLGLNSLFISILQVLNLAELGVGSAMVYSMYKPIANDDVITICALMKLYRTYYRVIGLVIAVAGCAVIPFIPHLIKSDVPDGMNIYILYLLNLGATVLSYWMFAYKNSILQAHQRTDVVSRVTLVTSTGQYGLQIVVLWLFHNYYLYIIVSLATQVLNNITTAVCANKLYPQFIPKGKLPQNEVKQINQRIKDLFTAKLGGTIINSADTVVISAFLGLTQLAVYQNYYFIMNSICGLISVFLSSITAGIGNSLVTETRDKNFNDFKKFTFIICFILCICCCCFVGLYQPFMRMWVGEELMLGFEYVIMFCLLFYCLELAMVWATIKDAAGIWHEDRFRPLIGSMVNLVLNMIMVNHIGLYGIILSTIISYIFVSMPWLIHNLFTLVYKRHISNYIKDVVEYFFTTVLCCLLCDLICRSITFTSFVEMVVKLIVCIGVALSVQIILFSKKKEYIESKDLLKRMMKSRR